MSYSPLTFMTDVAHVPQLCSARQMDEHVINLEQERIAHMRTRAKMQSFTGQLEEAWMGNAALQDTVNQQQQEIQQVRDRDSCTAGCLL